MHFHVGCVLLRSLNVLCKLCFLWLNTSLNVEDWNDSIRSNYYYTLSVPAAICSSLDLCEWRHRCSCTDRFIVNLGLGGISVIYLMMNSNSCWLTSWYLKISSLTTSWRVEVSSYKEMRHILGTDSPKSDSPMLLISKCLVRLALALGQELEL